MEKKVDVTEIAFPANVLIGKDALPRVIEAMSSDHWILTESNRVLEVIREYYKSGGLPEDVVGRVKQRHAELSRTVRGYPDFIRLSNLPYYILPITLFQMIDRLQPGEFDALDRAVSDIFFDCEIKDIKKATDLDKHFVPFGFDNILARYSFYRWDFNYQSSPLARLAETHGFPIDNVIWNRVILIDSYHHATHTARAS